MGRPRVGFTTRRVWVFVPAKMARTMGALLSAQGHEVTIHFDAQQALASCASSLPDVAFLDLNMPVMGGIEFLQVVKQDAVLRRIPVVVLTTSDEQQDKVASFDLGVAGYIRKPVDYKQFVEAVRSIDAYWTLSELPQ